MIFTTLDLHIYTVNGPEPVNLSRPLRMKINHIIDSFSVRIPKKSQTLLFHKLNVVVSREPRQKRDFHSIDGYASAEVVDPNVASIYNLPRRETVERSIGYLLQGVRIAAKYDGLFAESLPLWEQLLSASHLEYDYYCDISRSQRSRRLRAETIIRITPTAYHYQVLVKNSKTHEVVKRHTVETTECLWPHYRGLGFSKIRWEDDAVVVGLTKEDEEKFRFRVQEQ